MVLNWGKTLKVVNYLYHVNIDVLCALSRFGRVWLFATLWTVACQSPLSMGFFQARVLEWVAIFFSRGSSQPRDRTWVAKSKGENERYTHVNAEFKRIARRDKKAFLSDQCKEIEENNRMGKTKDLFKKIRDTKGIFHAKIGSIKDNKWFGPNRSRRYQEEVGRIHRRTVQKPSSQPR